MAPRNGIDTVPSVSVVIPTQGTRADLLGVTIETLSEEACVAEIIVVADRTSSDSPLPAGKRRVRVIPSPGTGPNASRQAGLEAAEQQIVLFLDDDVVPEAGLAAGHAGHHAGTRDHL